MSSQSAPAPGCSYPLQEIPCDRPGKIFAGRLPGWSTPSLEGDLDDIFGGGVDRIVCLVPPDDIPRYGARAEYPALARERIGARFMLFPIVEFDVPTDAEAFASLVEELDRALSRGERILVHCVAGCGRTGTLVSCLLVRQGLGPREAIQLFTDQRGCGPETREQERWVVSYSLR